MTDTTPTRPPLDLDALQRTAEAALRWHTVLPSPEDACDDLLAERAYSRAVDDPAVVLALVAEVRAARAILSNAHDVLAVYAPPVGQPWIRTLRDNLAGYLRRDGAPR